MFCYCKNKGNNRVNEIKTLMFIDSDRYIISGNQYQRYICPECEKVKVRLLNPFWRLQK